MTAFEKTPLNALKVLETSISDVGIWSWWGANLPESFQVEFAGTQLWNPPPQEGGPPSGQVALAFNTLRSVAFLTAAPAGEQYPKDWPQQLHADKLSCPTVSHDYFTLTSPESFCEIVSGAGLVTVVCGDDPRTIIPNAPGPTNAFIAFWAGGIGLAVIAKELEILNHHGNVSWDSVFESRRQWWAYWKEYWRRKESSNPMPQDYACEVTIPMNGALD